MGQVRCAIRAELCRLLGLQRASIWVRSAGNFNVSVAIVERTVSVVGPFGATLGLLVSDGGPKTGGLAVFRISPCSPVKAQAVVNSAPSLNGGLLPFLGRVRWAVPGSSLRSWVK
jgi:hypothetical protein